MHEKVLNGMRALVLASRYVMTDHAENEMDDEGFTIYDVESAILTGTIQKRQKDQETGEWKYVVRGNALSGIDLCVVAKIGPMGKLVFITVFTP